MKVRLLVSRCGPGIDQLAGQEIEVDDDEAHRMIESEQAVPVEAKKNKAASKKAE